MKKRLRFLKNIRALNFFRRVFNAGSAYNKKYIQILKWGFSSKEDTNFTYSLTPMNTLYLAHTISAVTGVNYKTVVKYFNEIEDDAYLKTFISDSIKRSAYNQ